MSVSNGFSQYGRIIKKHEIRDGISPKSVVSSGKGLFAAQNMMYRHTVTIYDKDGNRKAKIRDAVNLKKFGFNEYQDDHYLGGPVEAAWTKDGKYLWVSNYSMIGEGFEKPGCDACHGSKYDPGFLYKINASNFEIENVVKVGAVPKFLAITEDQSKLVVSNWSSGDVSIVDLTTEQLLKNVYVGPHPRGIDITADSKKAFVTVMGSTKVAEVDLNSYEVSYLKDIGRSPRSLILGSNDSVMYISMNSEAKVVKYNRFTRQKSYCKTAGGPRSMCMAPEEDYLYVVNYFDNSFSKIRTADMHMEAKVKTSEKPIGICGNWEDSEIWVACYSGKIEIFKDFHLDSLHHGNSIFGFDLSSFWATQHKEERSSLEESINEDDEHEEETGLDVEEVAEEVTESSDVMSVKKMSPKQPLLRIQKNRFTLAPTSEEGCTYHVIAGSFSVLDNAHSRKDELIQKGFQATVIQGSLNYVSAVCYGSRSDAEEGVGQVKKQTGYSAWILKR